MLKVVKFAASVGAMCQWALYLFLASSVALALAAPELDSMATTWALVISMAVGVCLEVWCIDR